MALTKNRLCFTAALLLTIAALLLIVEHGLLSDQEHASLQSVRHVLTERAHWSPIAARGSKDTTKLVARVESANLWNNLAAQGRGLNELMRSQAVPEKDQTPWTNYKDIETYGWRVVKGNVNEDELTSAKSALKALHIPNLDDKTWRLVEWQHSKSTAKVGKQKVDYPATKGHFRNFYNPRHGIIVASSNESPENAENKPSRDKMVPLRHWSDIAYLTWANECKKHTLPPGKLKYIVRINIISPEARPILSRIAGQDLKDYDKPFPGDTVAGVPDSEEARVTISFPNGRGIAWMLIQHKDQMGSTRHIRDIKFWESKDGNDVGKMAGLEGIPNMMYTLS